MVIPAHLRWIVGHTTRTHRKSVRVKHRVAVRATIVSRMRERLLAHPRFFYLGEEMTDAELLAVYTVFGDSILDTLALRGEVVVPRVVDIRMVPKFRQTGHGLPADRKATVSAFLAPKVSLAGGFTTLVRAHAVGLGLEDPNVFLQSQVEDGAAEA